MKKLSLIVIASLFFIIGCSDSMIEKAILSHEQFINGVQTDLNMNILSLQHSNSITVNDSLLCLNNNLYKIMYHDKIPPKDSLCSFNDAVEILSMLAKRVTILNNDNLLAQIEADSAADNWNEQLTEVLNLKTKYDYYITQNSDSILVDEYRCTYTIINPFLNNAKQTITKSFYFSNGNKIVYQETL